MLVTGRLGARSEALHPCRLKCPHCSSALVVAEEARLGSSGRIDYNWLCDDCGNAFSTWIELGQNFGPLSPGRAADHEPAT
jgi:transposase-like protein